MDCGTIDYEGFRRDLASEAQNNYPPLQLVKLPFNWFTLQGGGIRQFAQTTQPSVTTLELPSPVANGSGILVYLDGGAATGAPVSSVTDSNGDTYTLLGGLYELFNTTSCAVYWCASATGGSTTLTASFNFGLGGIMALELGGVSAIDFVEAAYNTVLGSGLTPGNTALAFGSSDIGAIGAWTQTSGWTLIQSTGAAFPGNAMIVSQQVVPGGGAVGNTMSFSQGTGGRVSAALVVVDFNPAEPPTAPPVTSLALSGPMNFFALVSEAIDEQGQYQESAVLGQQAAAGFIRLNGQGNVWIPVSFLDPLTPGYVTTNDNLTETPIQGTGFSGIEAPFGQLDWQPAVPVYYSGDPPAQPAGYLLAIVGVNVGVGSNVGNGDGSTYAIPSGAGPVERLKDAGLLL